MIALKSARPFAIFTHSDTTDSLYDEDEQKRSDTKFTGNQNHFITVIV